MTVSLPVVLDNTVLANFALAECAELVGRLWGDGVQTTSDAMAEYLEGVANGSVPAGVWKELAAPGMTSGEEALCKQLPTSLGIGERSCLAVARRRGGILASDDLSARRQAAAQDVPVTGTIGILIGCIRRDLLDLEEGNRLLKVMIKHGYHSPAGSLDGYF